MAGASRTNGNRELGEMVVWDGGWQARVDILGSHARRLFGSPHPAQVEVEGPPILDSPRLMMPVCD